MSQARDDLPLLPPSLEQQEKLCGKQVSILVYQACAVKIGGCVAVNRDEWSTSNLLSFSL